MKISFSKALYYSSYLTLFLLSLAVFYIFRPFTIIDHDRSKVICQKNNLGYELGLNLIFLIDEKLDPQTDKNVRKLCEYSIINDFQDTYKTPSQVNYYFNIVRTSDGSWGDTLLVSFSILFFGSILVEATQKILSKEQKSSLPAKLFMFAISVAIFFLLLRSPSHELFCQRMVASKLANFKLIAHRYGLARLQQEDSHIQPFVQEAYLKCLKNK